MLFSPLACRIRRNLYPPGRVLPHVNIFFRGKTPQIFHGDTTRVYIGYWLCPTVAYTLQAMEWSASGFGPHLSHLIGIHWCDLCHHCSWGPARMTKAACFFFFFKCPTDVYVLPCKTYTHMQQKRTGHTVPKTSSSSRFYCILCMYIYIYTHCILPLAISFIALHRSVCPRIYSPLWKGLAQVCLLQILAWFQTCL